MTYDADPDTLENAVDNRECLNVFRCGMCYFDLKVDLQKMDIIVEKILYDIVPYEYDDDIHGLDELKISGYIDHFDKLKPA